MNFRACFQIDPALPDSRSVWTAHASAAHGTLAADENAWSVRKAGLKPTQSKRSAKFDCYFNLFQLSVLRRPNRRAELPQRDEGIHPRHQKMRPALVNTLPESLRFFPFRAFDATAVF